VTAPLHGQEAHVTLRATYRLAAGNGPYWVVELEGERNYIEPDDPAVVSWEPAPPPQPQPEDWLVGAVMRDGQELLCVRDETGWLVVWRHLIRHVTFDAPPLPWTRYEPTGQQR
jgi:hypothetical protein